MLNKKFSFDDTTQSTHQQKDSPSDSCHKYSERKDNSTYFDSSCGNESDAKEERQHIEFDQRSMGNSNMNGSDSFKLDSSDEESCNSLDNTGIVQSDTQKHMYTKKDPSRPKSTETTRSHPESQSADCNQSLSNTYPPIGILKNKNTSGIQSNGKQIEYRWM
jgi:hypothetical protein